MSLINDDQVPDNEEQPGEGQPIEPQPTEAQMNINYEVQLVSQPTDKSCWAASMAMIVGYRDNASYTPDTIAAQAGMNTDTGYGWNDILNAVSAWGLKQIGPASAMPDEWGNLLQSNGPLWIVEIGNPYHAVVVGGIDGDGTPEGTTLIVYNPGPPNQGAVEQKKFLDFDSDFGLGAGANAQIVCA